MGLKQLRSLSNQGNYQELLDQFAEMEEKGQISVLSLEKRIEFIFYKSQALEMLGQFKKALETATQDLSFLTKTVKKTHTLALYVAQIFPLISMGRLKEALEINEKGTVILDSLKEEEYKEGKRWIAAFLQVSGDLAGRKGDFDSRVKYYKRSLALRESFENSTDLAEILIRMGGAHWSRGELRKSLKYVERGLSLSKSTGNSFYMANALNILGLVHRDKGDYDSALDFYQQSLDLWTSIGNNLHIAVLLSNIGYIHLHKGELDLAQEHFERSLSMRRSIGDPERIATVISNIGTVFWQQGKIELAKDHFRQSLQLKEEAGSRFLRGDILFSLLSISLEKNNKAEAQNYLSQLKALRERSSDKITDHFYRFAKALILKASSRLINKAKAQEILLEIMGEEEVSNRLIILVLIHLCELLLDELRAFGDPTALQEAKILVEDLYTKSQKQHSFSLGVQALILQARFAMIDGELEKSAELLEKARSTAEEKRLGLFTEIVSFETQKLEEQLETWEKLIQDNAPFQERLQQANVVDYLHQAKKLVSFEKR